MISLEPGKMGVKIIFLLMGDEADERIAASIGE
jgi:hypothetical protein